MVKPAQRPNSVGSVPPMLLPDTWLCVEKRRGEGVMRKNGPCAESKEWLVYNSPILRRRPIWVGMDPESLLLLRILHRRT